MKVLIAEDDDLTREGLAEVMRTEGYEVTLADNGAAAIDAFSTVQPDFVCLDIMMPEQSGYDACRAIRKVDADVPIIFISAKSEEVDKLVGFEIGADDFIVKPFSVREVLARIRAVTRRCFAKQPATAPASFVMGDLEVLPTELRARRSNDVIELSLRDVSLLKLFHRNASQVLERHVIYRECWGEEYFPDSRTLDQHVSQLRKRIEVDPKSPQIIRTVHGAGYRYDPA